MTRRHSERDINNFTRVTITGLPLMFSGAHARKSVGQVGPIPVCSIESPTVCLSSNLFQISSRGCLRTFKGTTLKASKSSRALSQRRSDWNRHVLTVKSCRLNSHEESIFQGSWLAARIRHRATCLSYNRIEACEDCKQQLRSKSRKTCRLTVKTLCVYIRSELEKLWLRLL